jgi:F-type H+-transporting ATPase subunit b
MKNVKRLAGRISLLTVSLWFALMVGAAFGSEQAGHAPADQATVAVAEHGTADAAAPHGDTHAAAAGEEHGGGHKAEMFTAAKWKDLGWRVVNFIALMIILVKFGAKPIGAGLSARRNKIKDEIEDLEAKRAKAEQSYNEFQAKLAGVEAEIDKVVERAVAQAEVEKQKILEKAEQAAADIKRSAEQAVQNEITEARRILKHEVADQAAVMAEELIVKNLTVDDQVKIIENYLAKVGAVQ